MLSLHIVASVLIGVLLSVSIISAGAADNSGEYKALKTFGTAGKELHPFTGGKEADLFRHDGAGCLTHLWFGGDFPGYERTRIRIYVDGEDKAFIDMELGLGHGIG